jgi:3'(2'), 5'-bisphosphate nucleotidase
MIEETELKHLLLIAINTAFRAGALIMDVYGSDDFQVNLKSDATPLTLADRKANTEIVESLIKTRIPVLSEEGRNILYEERKGWEYFWLVDPLDGTKEFIKRNGEFTVNIALVYNGYPIMGVVYVPVLEQLYFGLQKFGSFKVNQFNGELQGVSGLEELMCKAPKLPLPKENKTFIIVTSRSHPSKETQEYIDKQKSLHGEVKTIPRGSSLKICMVAEGQADVYPRFGKTTEWDTAAGQAIAENAGIKVLSLEDGKRLIYNKEDLENPFFIVKLSDEIES